MIAPDYVELCCVQYEKERGPGPPKSGATIVSTELNPISDRVTVKGSVYMCMWAMSGYCLVDWFVAVDVVLVSSIYFTIKLAALMMS